MVLKKIRRFYFRIFDRLKYGAFDWLKIILLTCKKINCLPIVPVRYLAGILVHLVGTQQLACNAENLRPSEPGELSTQRLIDAASYPLNELSTQRVIDAARNRSSDLSVVPAGAII